MIKFIYWSIIINLIIPTIAFAEDYKDQPVISKETRKLISETLNTGIGSIIKGLIILAVVSWLADIVLDPLNKKDLANKIYLIIRFYAYYLVVSGGLKLVSQVLGFMA
jgi:uncharacterized membrane protein (DUF485 family)